MWSCESREDKGEESCCNDRIRRDAKERLQLRRRDIKSQSLYQSLGKSKWCGWRLSLRIIVKDATRRTLVVVHELGGVFDIELGDLGVGRSGTNPTKQSQCCCKGPIGDIGSVTPEAITEVLQ